MTDWKDIKALTIDVDGVMTDGSLIALSEGDLVRFYNSKDTFAIRMLVMQGIKVGVITGGNTPGIFKRFLSLRVEADDIHMGSRGKVKVLDEFCTKYGLKPEQVAYVGDDIPDVPVLKAVGLGIAPKDACEEAREAADIVSEYGGGHGCIRWVAEQILKSQGLWKFNPEDYERLF